MHIFITVCAFILILAGIVGSIIAFLPGPPLALAGIFLYAFFTHFQSIGWLPLVIFSLLTIVEEVLSFFAPALGAKGYKASKWGFIGSMVGGFLGIFIFPPLGIIIGPFLGAFIGEYLKIQNTDVALKVAWGSFVGFVVGSLVRLALAISMLVYFIYILIK